jgi:ketosteroid isomerase-like protein
VSTETPLELVRRGSEAFERGDYATAFATWDPDVAWDTTHFEAWPDDAVYQGRDEVIRFLQEEWVGGWASYEPRMEGIFNAGDQVVVFWNQRMVGRESGIEVEGQAATVCTVRDGLVTRIDNYTDRDEAMRAAGLDPQQA